MSNRIITTEEELKTIVSALVEAKLSELFSPIVSASISTTNPKWASSSEAEKLLGMRYDELARKRRAGLFNEGVHYRVCNDNPSARANGVRYEYNIEAIDQRLSEKRSKRKIS